MNLTLPPLGRPAIKDGKFVVFGGRVLLGELPREQWRGELARTPATKKHQEERAALKKKIESGWKKDGMDRKRGVEYVKKWNGFDASEYLPRQIVPDFDRAVYKADQLTDRDMRLYLQWHDDTLGTFPKRYGKTKPSPTHPSKQPALLTGYMKRQQKQKESGVTQASSSTSGSKHAL